MTNRKMHGTGAGHGDERTLGERMAGLNTPYRILEHQREALESRDPEGGDSPGQ